VIEWCINTIGANNTYGNITTWDVSRITYFDKKTFQPSWTTGCNTQYSFNPDVSQWDVSNVTSMDEAFMGMRAFTADLSQWNVSKVTSMESIFDFAQSF